MNYTLATRAIAIYLRELMLPYLYSGDYKLLGRILSFERPWYNTFNYNHSQNFMRNGQRLGYFCQCRMYTENKFLCTFVVWNRKTEYLPRLLNAAPERNILGDNFFVYLNEDIKDLGVRILERLNGGR
jgi:hypothetical protein